MPTGIQGLRGSGEFDSNFRPTNYRSLYTLLEPNGSAPFNALLAMTTGEATDDPKINHFRDEIPERVVKINMAGTTSATTTSLTIDADVEIGFLTAGTLLANARTGEIMRVTTDAPTGTTLAVARNLGTTGLTILDNDELFVSGFAAADGSDVSTAVSFDPSVVFNYTQIFRTPFAVTNTLKATYRRTGDAEDEYATKALKLHMQEIERAMFFGKRHIEAEGAFNERRYTGGLLTSITNITDGATFSTPGQMTEDEFDSMLINTIFAFGSQQKLAFVGSKVAAHLQRFGKSRWQPTVVSGTYGVNVTRYSTMAGDLMVHLHPQFRQVPSMDSAMVIVDMPHVKYRYLEGRDTQLLRDRQGNGVDGVIHEYLSDCALELTQDKVHTYIKGWSTTA
jgi:hypothetical protein